MKRAFVESSMIESIGYDEAISILEIEFREGAIWQYSDFPEFLWHEFDQSGSKGKFFHQRIKGQFPEYRVG